MNDVKLSGRLTRDPELKQTPNGVPVATFALAVDRKFNREEADFIPVTTWRKTAEFVAKYFRKGQRVIIASGRIRTWQKAGFRAYPVKKEPGSVKAQIDFLKGRKIHIHPSCVNVLKEVQQWKWKKDPTTGLYIDEPVEFMDDAMAALRYGVERPRRGSSIEVLK